MFLGDPTIPDDVLPHDILSEGLHGETLLCLDENTEDAFVWQQYRLVHLVDEGQWK